MKRFTETQKWRDTWFLDLPAVLKLAYNYVLDNCDAAGVWEPNKRLADFSIGEAVNWSELEKQMGPRLTILSDGKWLLTRFVEFQYGKLSTDCRPHVPVLRLIEKYISIGYPAAPDRVSDRVSDTLKEQDKDTDKEKEQDREPEQSDAVRREVNGTIPQVLADVTGFRDAWGTWIADLAERDHGKVPTTHQLRLHLARLLKLTEAGWNPILIIETSIARKLREPDAPLTGKGTRAGPPQPETIPENVRIALANRKPAA